MNKQRVVIGMSGGVDSAVSALLLKQQGYEVIGLFMKNWEEKDGSGICQSTADYQDVVRVCEHLDIPYYTVNFVEQYWDLVFSDFLRELKEGYTPNPDILCNREIKFKALLEKALGLKADYLATGHYAQIRSTSDGPALVKGLDPTKDQSYFLYTLSSSILSKVLFPIGHLEKKQVREIARAHGLPNAEKKDSTGICFIGKRDFKTFINRYIAYQKGEFQTLKGQVIGEHEGFAYYTIGQRKGLNIGGPGDAWFVVGKDMQKNIVYVEQGSDHPALYADTLVATDLSWVNGHAPSPLPFSCSAKIRYRQADQDCVIEKIENDQLWVRFPTPQRAITPRQSIVFYQGDTCLGGAMISPINNS